jgi:hypothetical protein
MENTSLSPALTRMTDTVSAMVSFQEGSQLLQELVGVVVDAKQVERTAEALGEEIAEDERRHSEPLDALPLPKTLYLGIDGTGIPLRAQELSGVPGKREGAAKTREVKLRTSGLQNRSIAMALRSEDRSAIRQPSRVLSFRTSPRNVPSLLRVSGVRPSGAVSPWRRVPRRSEMVPLGSGIWSRSCSPGPSRSSKEDEALVRKAGSCTNCLKSTGRNTPLFGETADACTDGACFHRKLDAHVAERIKQMPDLVMISDQYGVTGETPVLPSRRHVEVIAPKAKEGQGHAARTNDCART